MNCRSGCGACCIAPSITSPLPGMPDGKPAGVACIHLDSAMACELFDSPERPDFCARFAPESSVCGSSREQALATLRVLDVLSA
ncbi:MAG TPA: zinc/iron-chelating domain-containing protein [Gammaproteobacteria bacterium]|nr:zinc/iron-chelating domain-containing protein [Gammaproteobacteria bacterium]